jgi:hypothetical protein
MMGIKGRFAALAALLSVVLLFFIPAAVAEGPNAVLNLAGCTTNTLPANDDGYTGVNVPIGFTADFYGDSYTQLSVNNNGNVTFDAGLSTYTPYDFTVTGNVIIAPFLADVDTRGTGTSPVTYGQTTYNGNQAFCVNWVNVGYFSNGVDKLNSFQLLLVKQGTAGDFDIIFNYDKVQWETGTASGGSDGLGGTSAAVGFANGDGGPDHFYVRDGSYTNGALLDSNSSTGLVHGSLGTTQLGRYIFQVRNVAPTGSTLTGTVYDPSSSTALAQAPVEICRTGGSCFSRFTNNAGVYRAINLVAGSYTVTAHPRTSDNYTDGHGGPITVSGTPGASFTQDVTLGPAPGAPPAGTTITNVGTQGGIPVVFWGDPLTLTTEACINGSGSYQITAGGSVVRSGSMTETPGGSGHYVGTAAALYPTHGDAQVHIAVNCPGATPDVSIDFSVYIDPSGTVVDAGTGLAISGATVTLLRSDNASGPFIPVPNGSAVMSAANRNNPDTTASDGTFGWDVIAGYYKVHASSTTCGSVDSDVMNIPPPVNNLLLQLPCPHNLTVSKAGAGNGTVTSSPTGITCGSTCVYAFNSGTSVTLTAAPAANSRFSGWSGGGCTGSGSCQITMGGDTTVTATFALIPPIQTKITKTKVNAKKRMATFKFSGSGGQGSLSFQCKLDKKKYSSCKSGKTYKKLKPGKHTFLVRAKDSRGKVDTSPATKKFKIKH